MRRDGLAFGLSKGFAEVASMLCMLLRTTLESRIRAPKRRGMFLICSVRPTCYVERGNGTQMSIVENGFMHTNTFETFLDHVFGGNKVPLSYSHDKDSSLKGITWFQVHTS